MMNFTAIQALKNAEQWQKKQDERRNKIIAKKTRYVLKKIKKLSKKGFTAYKVQDNLYDEEIIKELCEKYHFAHEGNTITWD